VKNRIPLVRLQLEGERPPLAVEPPLLFEDDVERSFVGGGAYPTADGPEDGRVVGGSGDDTDPSARRMQVGPEHLVPIQAEAYRPITIEDGGGGTGATAEELVQLGGEIRRQQWIVENRV
jgi:hypothetical protein